MEDVITCLTQALAKNCKCAPLIISSINVLLRIDPVGVMKNLKSLKRDLLEMLL